MKIWNIFRRGKLRACTNREERTCLQEQHTAVLSQAQSDKKISSADVFEVLKALGKKASKACIRVRARSRALTARGAEASPGDDMGGGREPRRSHRLARVQADVPGLATHRNCAQTCSYRALFVRSAMSWIDRAWSQASSTTSRSF
jgi:hypothetical protein